VYPVYCTDFCSALHQEMQGYVRVSPVGSHVALTANSLNGPAQAARAAARGVELPKPADAAPAAAHAGHSATPQHKP